MQPDRPASLNFETALHLGSLGIPVFPTQVEGEKRKQPVPGLLWRQRSSADKHAIEAMWRMHREAAPAIDVAKTDFVIIDCDAEKPGKHVHGVAWFRAECERREFDLTSVPIVSTPSGGWHAYFRQPAEGERLGNSRGSLPPKKDTGVDVRGSGGYVLAPGGEIDIGRYELLEGLELSEAPEAPDWLVDMLRGKRAEAAAAAPAPAPMAVRTAPVVEVSRREAYVDEAFRREVQEVATTGDGGRNIRLNQAAFSLGQLVAGGVLSEGEVISALRAAADACGLLKDDGAKSVDKTIRSGLRGGKQRPRTGPEDDGMAGDLAHGAMLARRLLARSESGELVDQETGEILPEGDSSAALHWAGEQTAPRNWILKGLLPARGCGLLGGTWAAGKTFAALGLAGAIGSGEAWLGHRLKEPVGTLIIAAEGGGELPTRLEALANSLGTAADRLPIAWSDGLAGPLIAKGAGGRIGVASGAKHIIDLAAATDAEMRRRFDLRLGLIVIDTLASAAGFTDENSAAEAATLMTLLADLSHQSGCFVLGIDHFGKSAESGVRGSSAKEAGSDLVLAAIAEVAEDGATKRTMVVRKTRWGATGAAWEFELVPQKLGVDEDGDPITSCSVEFSESRAEVVTVARSKSGGRRLSGGSEGYRSALSAALDEHGHQRHPLGADGPLLRVVDRDRVRAEFATRYPVDGADPQQALRRAFARAEDDLIARKLIGRRVVEDGARVLVWHAVDTT